MISSARGLKSERRREEKTDIPFISTTLERKNTFTAIFALSSENCVNQVLKTSDIYTDHQKTRNPKTQRSQDRSL